MQNLAAITINALIHYMLLYVAYKTDDYSMINKNSVCGGTNGCMNAINDCLLDYYDYDDIEGFEECFSRNVFGVINRTIDFPNKTEYYEKMYNVIGKINKIKKVYFEFILNSLKECADNEELYNNLYKYLKLSIYIDENNIGDFNVNIIEDEEVKKIADKLFYIDQFSNGKLFNKYLNGKNGTKFQNFMNKFFNTERKSDYSTLYEIINEKYFDNTLKNEDIGFILENYNTYNMQTFLHRNNVNATSLEKFNREFLMYYDKSIDVVDIVKMMANNNENEHNVFDMLINISTFLNRNTYYRYMYNDQYEKMNTLDINSFYENAKSLAEVIYNLIFDYYNYIYDNSQNDKNSESFRPIYQLEGNTLHYTIRNGDTIDKLENSNFYSDIYNTIISLEKKNKDNAYISKCVTLVQEIFKYYTSDYELKPIEKESINYDGNDIDYSTDLNKKYKSYFRENTFNYMIENKSRDIYKTNLFNYITNSYNNYIKDNESYYFDVLSVIRLENSYNSYNMDDRLSITDQLKNSYEEIYKQWVNPPLEESLSEDEYSDIISSLTYKAIKDESLKNLIKEDLNNTLVKRATTGDESAVINIYRDLSRFEDEEIELSLNGYSLGPDVLNNLGNQYYPPKYIIKETLNQNKYVQTGILAFSTFVSVISPLLNSWGGNHMGGDVEDANSLDHETLLKMKEESEANGVMVDDLGNFMASGTTILTWGVTYALSRTVFSRFTKYKLKNHGPIPSSQGELISAIKIYNGLTRSENGDFTFGDNNLKINANLKIDSYSSTDVEITDLYCDKVCDLIRRCRNKNSGTTCKLPKNIQGKDENQIKAAMRDMLDRNGLNKYIDLNIPDLDNFSVEQFESVINELARPVTTKVAVDLAEKLLDSEMVNNNMNIEGYKGSLDSAIKYTMKTVEGFEDEEYLEEDEQYINEKLVTRNGSENISNINRIFGEDTDFLQRPFVVGLCYRLENNNNKRNDKVCRISGKKNKGKLKKC